MILLATDILIWLLRGDESVRKNFENAIDHTGVALYITPIQITEIYAGIKEHEKSITEF